MYPVFLVLKITGGKWNRTLILLFFYSLEGEKITVWYDLTVWSALGSSSIFVCFLTDTEYFYHPPAKLREGNVFSRICLSFCLSSEVVTIWSLRTYSNLFTWAPPPPTPGPVESCSLEEAGGWPLTERLSYFKVTQRRYGNYSNANVELKPINS